MPARVIASTSQNEHILNVREGSSVDGKFVVTQKLCRTVYQRSGKTCVSSKLKLACRISGLRTVAFWL